MTAVTSEAVERSPSVRARSARTGSAVLAALGVLALLGAVLTAALTTDPLRGSGSVRITGTPSSQPLSMGSVHLRAATYADRRELRLTIAVRNSGLLPVSVTGVEALPGRVNLLQLRSVSHLTLAPHATGSLTVTALMTNCERVSIRSSTLVRSLRLRTKLLGVVPRVLTVTLPEAVQVPSPRDEACPNSSPYTRPIG
jgi:hypothetical protein